MFNPKNNKSEHLTASRDIYNQEQGFTIKTDFVKLIENTETGVNSYNFPIIRDTPITQNIENLLLQSNDEGGYNAYIIEYGFTKEQITTL